MIAVFPVQKVDGLLQGGCDIFVFREGGHRSVLVVGEQSEGHIFIGILQVHSFKTAGKMRAVLGGGG